MVYIIIDLETIFCRRTTQFGFIVEIGAVRIKEKNGKAEIVDSFHTYVRPPWLNLITQETLKFIGATKGCFHDAPRIHPAATKLKEWINEDDYYLCCWSDSEQWILAKNKTMEKTMDLSWVKNYNDIQPIISEALIGEPSAISLEKALELSGSTSEIKYAQHSAIVDAFSTASLFIKHFDSIKNRIHYKKNPFPAVSSPIVKTCRICKEEKHHTKFNLKNNRCKTCHNKRVNERRKRKQESEDALYGLSCGYEIY